MMKYAGQLIEGDRFTLHLSEYQQQHGRVRNTGGTVDVVVVYRRFNLDEGEEAELVVITVHGQRITISIPPYKTLEVESEGGVEYMSKFGDVYYESLSFVVK